MLNKDEANAPVKTKAVLIDPESMTAEWMNEAAREALSDTDASAPLGLTAGQAISMAEHMGVPEALRVASETGIAQHLGASLVSTAKGSMEIVTSVYRLPDGRLLVLTDSAWQVGRAGATDGNAQRPRRKAR